MSAHLRSLETCASVSRESCGETLAGLAGAVAGTAAGLGVAAGLRVTGFLPNVGVTLLASAAVLVAFLAVVAVADGGDLRAVTRRVIRL